MQRTLKEGEDPRERRPRTEPRIAKGAEEARKFVAKAGPEGVTINDVMAKFGVSGSTAQRILRGLKCDKSQESSATEVRYSLREKNNN